MRTNNRSGLKIIKNEDTFWEIKRLYSAGKGKGTMNRVLALTAMLLLCFVSKHHHIDAYPILIDVRYDKVVSLALH